MKKLLSLLVLLILLTFFLGCKAPALEVKAMEEEPTTEVSLDEELTELDELEQLMNELEGDVSFEELEDLSLE